MELSNKEFSLVITNDGEIKEISHIMYQRIKKELIEFRLEQSKITELPAYCVFPNKTLEKIALIMPREINELWLVDGMDEVLIDTYGKEICNIVKKILNEHEVLKVLYGYNVFNLSNIKVKAILGYENLLNKIKNLKINEV